METRISVLSVISESHKKQIPHDDPPSGGAERIHRIKSDWASSDRGHKGLLRWDSQEEVL